MKKIFYYTISGTKLRLRIYFLGFRLASIPMRKRVKGKLERMEVQQGKVVFNNFMGKGYGCNPKYITEALVAREDSAKLDLVWLVDHASEEQSNVPQGVRTVEAGSTQALQELASAQVWVSNCRMFNYFDSGLKKKENQTYIQTWHGILGIKKVEAAVEEQLGADHVKKALLDSSYTDYFLSPSDFDTQTIKSDFWFGSNILQCGYPRNDLLVASGTESNKPQIVARVTAIKKQLGLDQDVGILLYAPTFRGGDSVGVYAQLDIERLLQELQAKWQRKFVCLLRFHPNISDQSQAFASQHGYVDVTSYPDMAELLLVTDVLITDYSSCIFDFSLLKRPAFMVLFDENAYAQERGFYLKLSDMPFPLARTNDELAQAVANFDDGAYQTKLQAFQSQQGYYLRDDAGKVCAELIASICAQDPSQSSPHLELESGYCYLKRYLYAAKRVLDNLPQESLEPTSVQTADATDLAVDSYGAKGNTGSTIWQMWWQGQEQAPALVKKCMASVRHYYGDQVVVLTKDNYRQYVTVPDYIITKFEQGKIGFAAFSDIMRCLLLCEHGGLWVDATCLLTAPIPQEVFDQDIFYFKSVTWFLSSQAPNERMLELLVRIPTYLGAIHSGSSWFLRAKQQNLLMQMLRSMILEYWRYEEQAVDYYWFHLMLTVLIVNIPEAAQCYEHMLTLNNRNPHIMLTCLSSDFDSKAFEQMKTFSFVHKLTYKDLDAARKNPKSYLNHVLAETF